METIAAFIDGDNISHRDALIILQEMKGAGRLISCCVYGDWSDPAMRSWLRVAQENGLTTVQCEKISGKNSSDIKLMVDMMEYLYERSHITMFYIVTSDSDYRHVIPKIRSMGKKVNCIGSETANVSLKAICDIFTSVELLRRLNVEDEPTAGAGGEPVEPPVIHAREPSVSPSIKNKKRRVGKKRRAKIWKEIETLSNRSTRIDLGALNTIIQRKYHFDFREYDYTRMLPFIRDNFAHELHIKYNDGGSCYITIRE